MLLREMTSSAFAHSFKRFAQLAVVGLALAGLAACGGGGGSSPAEETPTPAPDPTPTPDPAPAPTPACPQGQVRVDGQCRAEIPIRPLNEYGAVAFSMNPWGWYASQSGTSRTAARDAAVANCERVCTDSSCGCQEVLWVRNACGSLAYSADNSRAGVGWDLSSQGDPIVA